MYLQSDDVLVNDENSYQAYLAYYQGSDAWALLRTRAAPRTLAFLYYAFKEEESPALSFFEVEGQLVDYLRFLGEEPEDEELEGALLVLEQDPGERARGKLNHWVQKGWLRKYPNDVGQDMLELTTATEKALAFVQSLRQRSFVGTESRFQDIFRKLEELVQGGQEDPQQKIAELKARKKEIDREIRQIKISGSVSAFNDTQIKERFHELNKTARELLSDFREVEKVFKDIVRDIYDRQSASTVRRGDLLGFALDQVESLKDNDQGRSFYAFWEYLVDDRKQAEMKFLVKALFQLLDERSIPVSDLLLRRLKAYLYQNGQKVFASNQLLAEKLNRIVAEQNLRERKQALVLIDQIRKSAQDRRDDPLKEKSFWAPEDKAHFHFPLERPLGSAPEKVTPPPPPRPAAEVPVDADLSELVNQFYVDSEVLRDHIRRLVREQGQVTLEKVLEKHPLEKGLAEIMAYFAIASGERNSYVHADETIKILLPGPPARWIQVPQLIFNL